MKKHVFTLLVIFSASSLFASDEKQFAALGYKAYTAVKSKTGKPSEGYIGYVSKEMLSLFSLPSDPHEAAKVLLPQITSAGKTHCKPSDQLIDTPSLKVYGIVVIRRNPANKALVYECFPSYEAAYNKLKTLGESKYVEGSNLQKREAIIANETAAEKKVRIAAEKKAKKEKIRIAKEEREKKEKEKIAYLKMSEEKRLDYLQKSYGAKSDKEKEELIAHFEEKKAEAEKRKAKCKGDSKCEQNHGYDTRMQHYDQHLAILQGKKPTLINRGVASVEDTEPTEVPSGKKQPVTGKKPAVTDKKPEVTKPTVTTKPTAVKKEGEVATEGTEHVDNDAKNNSALSHSDAQAVENEKIVGGNTTNNGDAGDGVDKATKANGENKIISCQNEGINDKGVVSEEFSQKIISDTETVESNTGNSPLVGSIKEAIDKVNTGCDKEKGTCSKDAKNAYCAHIVQALDSNSKTEGVITADSNVDKDVHSEARNIDMSSTAAREAVKNLSDSDNPFNIKKCIDKITQLEEIVVTKSEIEEAVKTKKNLVNLKGEIINENDLLNMKKLVEEDLGGIYESDSKIYLKSLVWDNGENVVAEMDDLSEALSEGIITKYQQPQSQCVNEEGFELKKPFKRNFFTDFSKTNPYAYMNKSKKKKNAKTCQDVIINAALSEDSGKEIKDLLDKYIAIYEKDSSKTFKLKRAKLEDKFELNRLADQIGDQIGSSKELYYKELYTAVRPCLAFRALAYQNSKGIEENEETGDFQSVDYANGKGMACVKKAEYTVDFKACTVALNWYNGLAISEYAGVMAEETYNTYKSVNIDLEAQKANAGDRQSAAYQAQRQKLEVKSRTEKMKAAFYTGKSAALLGNVLAIPSPAIVSKDCLEGTNKTAEDIPNPYFCEIAAATDLYPEQLKPILFPNQGIKSFLLKQAALSAGGALTAAILADSYGKQANAVKKVEKAFQDFNDTLKKPLGVKLTFCQQNPTAPSCRRVNGTKTTSSGLQYSFNGINGGTNDIKTNTEDAELGNFNDDDKKAVPSNDVVENLDDIFKGKTGNSLGNGFDAPSAGQVTTASGGGGGGGSGGGGGAGGGGGGGGGAAPANAQGSGNGDFGSVKKSKYITGGGSPKFVSGSSRSKKRSKSSNPFGKMFKKRSSRSVASEANKIHPQKISIFSAISERYAKVKKDKKISAE